MSYAITKRGSQDNIVTYEFICDTIEDMNAIEKRYRTIGSTAIVLYNKDNEIEAFIADSKGTWVSFGNVGRSSGDNSGQSTIPDGIYIYQDDEGYLHFWPEAKIDISDPIVGYGQVGHMIIHSVVDPTSPVVDEGQADYMIVAADKTSSTVDEGQADYMIVADDDTSSYIVGTGAADYMQIA